MFFLFIADMFENKIWNVIFVRLILHVFLTEFRKNSKNSICFYVSKTFKKKIEFFFVLN
jgi:hypothetical protein